MKEKDFQTTFNHWVKEKYKKSAVFELKKTNGNSLPFAHVVPHQVQALLKTQEGQLVYKIPDMGLQNPFDCFSLFKVPAFVVIKYPGFFCLINISDWINEKERSDRRSLTMSRACEIATIVVRL